MAIPSHKVPEFYMLIVSDKDGLGNSENTIQTREQVVTDIKRGDYYGSIHAVLQINSEEGSSRNISMEIAEELAADWISANELPNNEDVFNWVAGLIAQIDRDTYYALDNLYYAAA